MSEVARLLGLSKVAHLAYQMEQRKKGADYAVCEAHVAEALARRMEAHGLDPSHDDPIWASDEATWPHQKLIGFYERYASIP